MTCQEMAGSGAEGETAAVVVGMVVENEMGATVGLGLDGIREGETIGKGADFAVVAGIDVDAAKARGAQVDTEIAGVLRDLGFGGWMVAPVDAAKW